MRNGAPAAGRAVAAAIADQEQRIMARPGTPSDPLAER